MLLKEEKFCHFSKTLIYCSSWLIVWTFSQSQSHLMNRSKIGNNFKSIFKSNLTILTWKLEALNFYFKTCQSKNQTSLKKSSNSSAICSKRAIYYHSHPKNWWNIDWTKFSLSAISTLNSNLRSFYLSQNILTVKTF